MRRLILIAALLIASMGVARAFLLLGAGSSSSPPFTACGAVFLGSSSVDFLAGQNTFLLTQSGC